MKVTGLALVPPPTAADLPRVTPELLASVLARYSRSNEGLGKILEKVDVDHPDESIDRILKFVDYGHASIGGLTGGLAIALDNVSMWLAWKIFEIAQMADGQESSTRYITMDAANLPTPERHAGARCWRAPSRPTTRSTRGSISSDATAPGSSGSRPTPSPPSSTGCARTSRSIAPGISSPLPRGRTWALSNPRACGPRP
jgi:hypothetical protein